MAKGDFYRWLVRQATERVPEDTVAELGQQVALAVEANAALGRILTLQGHRDEYHAILTREVSVDAGGESAFHRAFQRAWAEWRRSLT